MSGQIKRADLAVIAGAGVFLGGISGVSIGAALALGPPWNLGAAGAGLFSGLMGLISMGAFTRLTLHLSPEPPEPPAPDTPRPESRPWEVARAFDIEVLPRLQGPAPENRLIQTVTGPDPEILTTLDCAYLLRECHAGRISRKALLGARLPSQRRLTRPLYDQFMDLASKAGVIQGRKEHYSGKLTAGLTLTKSLQAWGIDPESIAWDHLGSPGMGWDGMGTSSRFLVAKVINDERGVQS